MTSRAFDYLKASVIPHLHNMVTLAVTMHTECDDMQSLSDFLLCLRTNSHFSLFLHVLTEHTSTCDCEMNTVSLFLLSWNCSYSEDTFTQITFSILLSFSLFLYYFFHAAEDNTGSLCCDEERDLACPVQHNHSLLRRGRALGTSFGSACPSSFTDCHCKVC